MSKDLIIGNVMIKSIAFLCKAHIWDLGLVSQLNCIALPLRLGVSRGCNAIQLMMSNFGYY